MRKLLKIIFNTLFQIFTTYLIQILSAIFNFSHVIVKILFNYLALNSAL